MKVEMETSGDASRGDDVEQLEAREEAGDDHWVTSEVQGELRRGFSHRSRLWPERGDELELVSIRRRCTAVDCRFVDEDGDLNPPRAKKPRRSMSNSRDDGSSDQVTSESASDAVDCPDESDCLQLLVRPRTSWRVAGAQIWRAALLLAEFIDAKPEIFTDATVLELGCGVGLASIATARTARHVFATDGDAQALALAQKNVSQNCWRVDFQGSVGGGSGDQAFGSSATTIGSAGLAACCIPQLRVFDWYCPVLPWRAPLIDANSTSSPANFAWTQDDVDALAQLRVVIASDVLYDEDTARAFMTALGRIFLSATDEITAVVALERRPVFSASTLSIVSLGYDAFHAQLCLHHGARELNTVGVNRVKCRRCTSDVAGSSQPKEGDNEVGPFRFVARECSVGDIPHALDYDRPSTLMIWLVDAIVVE